MITTSLQVHSLRVQPHLIAPGRVSILQERAKPQTSWEWWKAAVLLGCQAYCNNIKYKTSSPVLQPKEVNISSCKNSSPWKVGNLYYRKGFVCLKLGGFIFRRAYFGGVKGFIFGTLWYGSEVSYRVKLALDICLEKNITCLAHMS